MYVKALVCPQPALTESFFSFLFFSFLFFSLRLVLFINSSPSLQIAHTHKPLSGHWPKTKDDDASQAAGLTFAPLEFFFF